MQRTPTPGTRHCSYCVLRRHSLTLSVDSNSTRTESYVAIRPDPEARMRVDAPKAVYHNGCQQIIHPRWGMRAGLKILCPVALQGC
jgi:hypothetical protein